MIEYDPITLEVLWNRLISIVNEQAAALVRASFTTIVREVEDLSCGIFDASANMVVQAVTGTPGHINTMATGVKHFIRKFPAETLEEGDVLITNDPWLVAGHKHDITICSPIFHRGRLVGFSASTCHVEDIGGRIFSADAREVFEEGLEIPVMKLFRAGRPNEDLFEMIQANVRLPQQAVGDIMAQVSSSDVAGKKLAEFLDEYKVEDFQHLSNVILTRSEEAIREVIRSYPDGVYTNSIVLDGFDEPLTIAVRVEIRGDEIYVDYTGTSPQVDRGINVVFNYTHAYTTYTLKAALYPDIPNNDGSFRPVHVTAPEGCLLNATFPAPVAARHLTGHATAPALFGALAKFAPDRVMADSCSLCISQFDGYNLRGRRFVANYFCLGGMGARHDKDGLSTMGFPTNVSNSPVEVTENTSPLFFMEKEFIPGSGGAGRFRGGLGQRLRIRVRSDRPATLSCMYERIKTPPLGFLGGENGRLGRVEILHPDGTKDKPHPKTKCILKPGDEVALMLAGGGGFYPPEGRDPKLRERDALLGLLANDDET